MGPFSHKPRRSDSTAARASATLPVPDVEPKPSATVSLHHEAEKKAMSTWLVVTLSLLGGLVVLGVSTLLIYQSVSNSPGYMLGAAVHQVVTGPGEAGNFSIESTKPGTSPVTGSFLAYTDPADPQNAVAEFSLGQANAALGAQVHVLNDATYVQTAGLAYLGQLFGTVTGTSMTPTADQQARLSALDGKWYVQSGGTVTSTDVAMLQRLYLRYPFFIVARQYADQDVNTIRSQHLKLALDHGKLAAFLQALQDAHLKSLAVTDDQLAMARAMDFGGFQPEVWIARSTKTFQQIKWDTKAGTDTQTVVINLKPETAIEQRQTVLRPRGALDISVLSQGISDILAPASTH